MADDECRRRYDNIMAALGPDHGLSTLDLFAELISGGPEEDWAIPVMQASVMLGSTPDYGNALLQRIRKGIGERAI